MLILPPRAARVDALVAPQCGALKNTKDLVRRDVGAWARLADGRC